MAKVLIVGGAGYIGSICGRALRDFGWDTATYDDLSTGHRGAVEDEFIQGDIRDQAKLTQVLKNGRFDAVMHFAARSLVGESVSNPPLYFDVNVGGTASLIQAMVEAECPSLVFSSTCAIYGNPEYLPLDESHPKNPVSPYGDSKATVERMLEGTREQLGLRETSLRYFNAAGATPDGALGESHKHETHLIPLALAAAQGKRSALKLFGTDYETRDGTCIRDYIHVLDLAQAHRLALMALLDGSTGSDYNVGTGQGTSVLEILDSIERVTGSHVPHTEADRRAGDPPELYAEAQKIHSDLNWRPEWTHIDDIVKTAAMWSQSPRY